MGFQKDKGLQFLLPIILLTFIFASCSKNPVLLVTEEEAAQPESKVFIEEKDDGPIINIYSPKNEGIYEGPFRLYVEVKKKEGGADVAIDSLKVFYVKLGMIDITNRLRDYIVGSKIDIPEAEFPKGKHKALIHIEDLESNISEKLFLVTVVEPD